ncbi:MAG: PKD domain-containing protein [Planctomycetota bacterium]
MRKTIIITMVLLLVTPSAFAGELVAWGGDNSFGQLDVPAGDDFIAVSGGAWHASALRYNGSLVGWGNGASNPPGGTDFVAVSSGYWCSLGLRSDGTVAPWGINSYSAPSGYDFDVISAGKHVHTLGLTCDGSIIGWGWNAHGQTNVPAGNDFVSVAAGQVHSLALTSNGSIVAWGNNTYGQGTAPVGNNFVKITAGNSHNLAIRDDGSLYAWGLNNYGQCNVPGGNDFIAIAAGAAHSLALRSDGSIVVWGRNNAGQRKVPVGNNFIFIAAGMDQSYAITAHPPKPPIANSNGPYTINFGDSLTLDASASTDMNNDITMYRWDLDDDGNFETYAGMQDIFNVNYSHLKSIGLVAGHTYNIHVLVMDSTLQYDIADSTLTIIPPPSIEVAVDIKPADCPNPLNVKSKGVLPVAILGSADFDVYDIDVASIQLAGVDPNRSYYEDVAGPVSDSNDCNCIIDGPDGFLDLTLKFNNQEIAEAIGDVNDGDVLELELTGVLFNGTPIEGADCILISGRHKSKNKADINKDGMVDATDFAIFSHNWMQSSIVEE